jgi:hypothetical protein
MSAHILDDDTLACAKQAQAFSSPRTPLVQSGRESGSTEDARQIGTWLNQADHD